MDNSNFLKPVSSTHDDASFLLLMDKLISKQLV